MNKLIICLLTLSFLCPTEIDIPKAPKQESPEDIKAYGTIDFGDSKEYIQSKLKKNGIYRDTDTGAYIIHLFDVPFEITFVYGTNDIRPTFLKGVKLKLYSIIDSHIITEVISAFDEQYGPSEKYYIDIYGDSKEYFRWEKDDRVVHLDFDGVNIDIAINSYHFNNLSKTHIEKEVEEDYKKKAERHKNQLEKLF